VTPPHFWHFIVLSMLLTLIIKSPDLSIAASSISLFDNPNIEVGIGGKCSILFIIFRSFYSISELYHFSVSTQTIKEPNNVDENID
jgi:hypothetical protein